MRRDQLEVGVKYRGVDDKCYEIVDLTPGWRIGYTQDWVKDDSTRLRVRNGHTIAFRNNNALRALMWDGEECVKAVVTPQRLLQPWEKYEWAQDVARVLEEDASQVIDGLRAWFKSMGHPAGEYHVGENKRSVLVPTTDLKILLSLAEMQGSEVP